DLGVIVLDLRRVLREHADVVRAVRGQGVRADRVQTALANAYASVRRVEQRFDSGDADVAVLIELLVVLPGRDVRVKLPVVGNVDAYAAEPLESVALVGLDARAVLEEAAAINEFLVSPGTGETRIVTGPRREDLRKPRVRGDERIGDRNRELE